jgi:hypothetical protein
MKDFKQNTKMSCEGSHYKTGGKVKKFEEGGDVNSESLFEKGSPERAKEKFEDSIRNRLKERFPDSEPTKVDRRPFENSAERGLRQLRNGTSGGGGGLPVIKGLTSNPNFNKKRGGIVKRKGK